MTSSLLGNLPSTAFFETYWRRQPTLIRGALAAPEPLGTDGLVALACTEDVESRLILEQGGEYPWQVWHGPFEHHELDLTSDAKWSLLVHDVQRHRRTAAVLSQIEFLPRWLLDDVMVSIAPPGGSVGAHIDLYDAFLLQVRGRREWRLESHVRPEAERDCVEGADVAVLTDFTPDEVHITYPGDVLYVPPGFAHHGVAIDDAETWSFGIRPPSANDLLSSLADFAIDASDSTTLYDPSDTRRRRANTGEITPINVSEIRAQLQQQLFGEDFERWLGEFLTTPRLGPESISQDLQAIDVQAGNHYGLRAGVRASYAGAKSGGLTLFVDGAAFSVEPGAADHARSLANYGQVHFQEDACEPLHHLLLALAAMGAINVVAPGGFA